MCYIIYTVRKEILRVKSRRKEKMEDKGMTNEQFKIVLEMILAIIEKSETKEEAVNEIKKLIEK